MRTFVSLFLATLLVLPALSTNAADEEQPLTGAEIKAALSGNTVFGEQDGTKWKQYFAPDGSTTYISGDDDPSPGKWRVDGDTFCSLWPPASDWDCYDMTGDLDASPPSVTWIYQGGGAPWPAVVKDGNQLE
ncbi:MAG: hypothetical protein R3316_03715 [Rhodovibrionaceae bacterium]|nr:hypothetical protein [Rhodovibrionaceae bacterium]